MKTSLKLAFAGLGIGLLAHALARFGFVYEGFICIWFSITLSGISLAYKVAKL